MASRKSPLPTRRRRKRGRPNASQEGVGREVIIAAGRRLLETHLPHRVTTLMIAQKAGVDPALIRYYFGSREELLLAITENIVMSWVAAHPPPNSNPAEKLGMQVREMVDFARTARSMQRLMIDEVAEARSPEIRKRVRELNARAVESYSRFFDQNDPNPLVPADPLLVYVAIIGMAEFFVAAQSMIVPLLPQKMSADELAERYKTFIVNLVLNGLRPRDEK